jgi:hypothetical protein
MAPKPTTIANRYQELGSAAEQCHTAMQVFRNDRGTFNLRRTFGLQREKLGKLTAPKGEHYVRIGDAKSSLKRAIDKTLDMVKRIHAEALLANTGRQRADFDAMQTYFQNQRDHWWSVARDYVRDQARKAKGVGRHGGLLNAPNVGAVVRYITRKRRYVVTGHDRSGASSLVALSGAVRGSAPSGVSHKSLVIDADQTVQFSGKLAGKLEARAAWEMGRQKWEALGKRHATVAAGPGKPPKGSEADAVRNILTASLALASDGRRLLALLQKFATEPTTEADDHELTRRLNLISRLHKPKQFAERMFPTETRAWTGLRTLMVQARGLGQPDEAAKHVHKAIGDLQKLIDRMSELARKHGPHAMPSGGLPPPGAKPIMPKLSADVPSKHALEQAARIVHDAWHKYLEQGVGTADGHGDENELDVRLDQARALGIQPAEEGRIAKLVKREFRQERARLQKQRDELAKVQAKRAALEKRAAQVEAREKARRDKAAAKVDRAAQRAQARELKSCLRHWTQAAERMLEARKHATNGHNHVDQQKRLEAASAAMSRARDAIELAINRGAEQRKLF